MNHLTAKAPYVLQHKRAVLRWIESQEGTISMGTLYGWLIYPVCEEVTAWEAQGEASSSVGLDSGRDSQVHKPPSSPGLVSAALWHCWAEHFGAQVLLQGSDSHPDPHGDLLWLTAPICLCLLGFPILPWAQGCIGGSCLKTQQGSCFIICIWI